VAKIDETFGYQEFASLNKQFFEGKLEQYHVVFKDALPERGQMECHPDTLEIWALVGWKQLDSSNPDHVYSFERILKHEMIHAELKRRGGAWRHKEPGVKEVFNVVAAQIDAAPEPGLD
jgi:hypothetical protein